MSSPVRELRCHCGSLVARLVGGKLELKCRRCQRVGLIDLQIVGGSPESVRIEWLPGREKPQGR